MYCTQNGNCGDCSLANYERDCHNNPVSYKRTSVRIPEGVQKEFAKKLIDNGLSAQTFFLRKVIEYLNEAE